MVPEDGSQNNGGLVLPNKRRVTQREPFSERRRSSILVGQRSIDIMALESPGNQGPKFVMFVIKKFRHWGYFIAEHDWQAMLICIIISVMGFLKVLTTPQENNITGYSPYGARARNEYTRYQEFFADNGLGIAVYIFATAKDGGSMLRSSYLKETVKILDDVNNVKLFDHEKNGTTGFNDFCISFCSINEPVRQFYNGLKLQSELAKKNLPLNPRINLDYPITNFFGRNITLQQSFFGIDFYNGTEDNLLNGGIDDLAVPISNDTMNSTDTGQKLTNMESAKIIVLQLRAEHKASWISKDIKNYEMEIVNRFQKNYKSEQLKTYILAQTYIEDEMVRAGISLLPYLNVGFIIMCICSMVSVVVRAIYMHQHSAPKILLAVMACVLPFMSCATALGLMFTCSLRFSSILCVIPFLVLAIGVDSSYLMIHEWQRVIKHCRDHPTRKNSNVGYRISEVLSEVGPAILISVLTNVFADGVGAFTSSPEITLLCVGNMISMAVAFFFQMTFYAGLFSLVGRYEVANEREERRELQASLRAAHLAQLSNGSNVKRGQLTRQHSKFHENTKQYISKSMLTYISYVATKTVAMFIVFFYFIYLAFVIWGITRIQINLTTQKLFALDSPLIELDQLRIKYQVPHFSMVSFFINRPGNLSDPAVLSRMNNFVDDLERIKGSWGRVGTQYFVRDFITFEESFEGELDEEEEEEEEEVEKNKSLKNKTKGLLANVNGSTPTGPFREEDLKNFIEWPEYSYWSGFMKLDENKKHLKKFFFTTAYHGKQLSIWTERGKFLNNLRRVTDKYATEFDASVFHEDGIFLDLIDNMPTDTWQSVVGTLICMGAVCFLFLNSMFTVLIASSCVLSICAGILGILSWFSIDLDPITMAAMIISIGCSVDIPAHVSYHYYQASIRELNATPQIKLVNCLSSVAFPALQAAISTILCVSSLLFVHIYMAEVFVKTMVICVVLCNLHGLVFLPAFLILFDSVVQKVQKLSQKVRPRRHIHGEDNDLPSRMCGEPPSCKPLSASQHKKGKTPNIQSKTNFKNIEHSKMHRNLSRISSKTENSFSSLTDRPELYFAPEETDNNNETKTAVNSKVSTINEDVPDFLTEESPKKAEEKDSTENDLQESSNNIKPFVENIQQKTNKINGDTLHKNEAETNAKNETSN